MLLVHACLLQAGVSLEPIRVKIVPFERILVRSVPASSYK